MYPVYVDFLFSSSASKARKTHDIRGCFTEVLQYDYFTILDKSLEAPTL
jgi:hypothetical protein